MEDFQVRIILEEMGLPTTISSPRGDSITKNLKAKPHQLRQCDSTLQSLLWADIKSYKRWDLP